MSAISHKALLSSEYINRCLTINFITIIIKSVRSFITLEKNRHICHSFLCSTIRHAERILMALGQAFEGEERKSKLAKIETHVFAVSTAVLSPLTTLCFSFSRLPTAKFDLDAAHERKRVPAEFPFRFHPALQPVGDNLLFAADV